MMLADAGADVLKVEALSGDDSRGWLPIAEREGVRESAYFLSANRGKRSVRLDLKSPEGAARLRDLAARADVLVENFRPGLLDRLGLGLANLRDANPRLVTLSITGFGSGGPDGHRPGFDQIVQAEAGLMSLVGEPDGEPTRVGLPIADLLAGMFGAYGVSLALRHRDLTGRGGQVDTSLLAAVVGVHAFQGAGWLAAGVEPRRTGNRHPSIAPYGTFRCADAELVIAVGSESLWRRFSAVVGLDSEPGGHRHERHVGSQSWTSSRPRSTWRSPSGPPRTCSLPSTRQGFRPGGSAAFRRCTPGSRSATSAWSTSCIHPELGRVGVPGPALMMDGTPMASTPRTAGARRRMTTVWMTSGRPTRSTRDPLDLCCDRRRHTRRRGRAPPDRGRGLRRSDGAGEGAKLRPASDRTEQRRRACRLYYTPGSLKATLCRRGVGMLREFCAEHGVAYDEIGKVLVALDDVESSRLGAIEERALAERCPGSTSSPAEELREIEPHVVGVAGLHSPTTAIVDFPGVTRMLARLVEMAGGRVLTCSEVVGLEEVTGGVAVTTRGPGGRAVRLYDEVVICAGLHVDRLARMVGGSVTPRITPFRGEYYTLVRRAALLVQGLVYPVPDPRYPFLGVHLTPRVDGEVLVGPNAVLALAREGYTWRQLSVPDLTRRWLIVGSRGLPAPTGALVRRRWPGP